MRKLSTQCMDDLEKSEKCPGGEKFASEANDGFLETVCEGLSSGTGCTSGALRVCVELRITERESILLGSLSFLCTFVKTKDKIMKHLIAPSLLSANFLDLRKEMEMINKSDADWLHLDIMDGVFVPNISFGFPVLNALKPICQKPMDVHLMIVEPQKFIPEVAATGAYMMNVHYEACTHLHRTVAAIKETGMKAGVTLNPHTPICLLEDIIQDVDMVLLMSVNPDLVVNVSLSIP